MTEEEIKKTPGSRKRGTLKWKSSKKGTPLPIKGIATALGLKYSRVYDIVAQGLLPAFVYDGSGTQLVEYIPATGTRPVVGQSIYAYSEDVEKLRKEREANARPPVPAPTISDEQRAAVIAEAERQILEKGYVSRREVLANLRWHSTKYPIIRVVCDEQEYPMRREGLSQYK